MAILRDVLRMMDARDRRGDKITFGIQYVSLDKGRKKGGQICTLDGVQTVGSVWSQKNNQMINLRAPGNTNHPFPVHIRLILAVKFNDKFEPVYW
jgi:hypothetical protein